MALPFHIGAKSNRDSFSLADIKNNLGDVGLLFYMIVHS